MKILLNILFVTFLSLILISCSKNNNYPSANFDSIVATSATGNIKLKYGAKCSITKIGVGIHSISNNVLTLSGAGNFEITAPDIIHIETGASNFETVSNFNVNSLSVEGGAGSVTLELNGKNVSAIIGAGNISIKGATDKLTVNVNAGNYDGCDFYSKVADVTVSMGNAHVYSTDTLKATIMAGNISYAGNPKNIVQSGTTIGNFSPGCK